MVFRRRDEAPADRSRHQVAVHLHAALDVLGANPPWTPADRPEASFALCEHARRVAAVLEAEAESGSTYAHDRVARAATRLRELARELDNTSHRGPHEPTK
jgi:hypothetical protein